MSLALGSKGFVFRLGVVFGISAFGFTGLAFGQESDLSEFARSELWLRALHYGRSFPWIFLKKSAVDGGAFFIDPAGGTDALSELRASIRAFRDPEARLPKIGLHPQCGLPFRYRVIKRRFPGPWVDQDCPNVREVLRNFNAESVALVFSSAHADNPGSMFGHTFLRFNSRRGTARKIDLLDLSVGYAAATAKEDSTAIFYWKGLFGGYPGKFSSLPYYAKVNEYLNSESRDLWEYRLSLSEEETELLLLHVYELEKTSYLAYFFFDENCSWILLALLEAVKPEWRLTAPRVFVIPGETIKTLQGTPGAILDVQFRPSMKKRFLHRYALLDSSQRRLIRDLIEGASSAVQASEIRDPSTLSTAALYFQYRIQKEGGDKSGKATQWKIKSDELLAARARLGKQEEQALPALEGSTRPDWGHHPSRFWLSGGANTEVGRAQSFVELGIKLPFHDLLNDDTGYARFQQIDFPGMSFRYYPQLRRFHVESISGLTATSLFPINFMEAKPSWAFKLGAFSPKDFGCARCLVFHLSGNFGGAVNVLTESDVLYALPGLYFEAGEGLRGRPRFGPLARLGWIWGPFRFFKFQLEYEAVADIFQPYRRQFFHQLSPALSMSFSPSVEVRLRGQGNFSATFQDEPFLESKADLNVYF